jgi:hypothetical protein
MTFDEDGGLRLPRRKLLTYLTSGAAMLGSGTVLRGQETGDRLTAEASVSLPQIVDLARLQNSTTRRSSSYDRTGGNADAVTIEPGRKAVLLDAKGAGTVTHIWFTIASDDPYHLKNLVLRAYWDGEQEPSVEVPVGDFFGLGLGEYFLYQSALTTVASMKGLNAYFPMPFHKSALITITNEGPVVTDSFYYNIDYISVPHLPEGLAYFHAQYRQAAPCRGWTDNWKNDYDPPAGTADNLTGKGNYIVLEAQGKGHLIGVSQSVLQNQSGWMGEGDEMIFIDNDRFPAINGTGTEDYFNGGWNFGAGPFAYMYNGAPYIVDPERIGGRYCMYRWHIDNPVRFQKSLRFTIEHGHANHRSDNYFSTAYWYQTEPHKKFPDLPKPDARVPRVYAVGGPGPAPLNTPAHPTAR